MYLTDGPTITDKHIKTQQERKTQRAVNKIQERVQIERAASELQELKDTNPLKTIENDLTPDQLNLTGLSKVASAENLESAYEKIAENETFKSIEARVRFAHKDTGTVDAYLDELKKRVLLRYCVQQRNIKFEIDQFNPSLKQDRASLLAPFLGTGGSCRAGLLKFSGLRSDYFKDKDNFDHHFKQQIR